MHETANNRISIYLIIIILIQFIALMQINFSLNLPGSEHYKRYMDAWI
jgi:hypothetical protein